MNKKVVGSILAGLTTLVALGYVSTTNIKVDIFLPETGFNKTGVILSQNNYSELQKNVAYMAVIHKQIVTEKANTNYCPLAQWIWDHQNGYYDNLKGLEKYVVPEYCKDELNPPAQVKLFEDVDISADVPEFGAISLIILTISIISIIGLTKVHTR